MFFLNFFSVRGPPRRLLLHCRLGDAHAIHRARWLVHPVGRLPGDAVPAGLVQSAKRAERLCTVSGRIRVHESVDHPLHDLPPGFVLPDGLGRADAVPGRHLLDRHQLAECERVHAVPADHVLRDRGPHDRDGRVQRCVGVDFLDCSRFRVHVYSCFHSIPFTATLVFHLFLTRLGWFFLSSYFSCFSPSALSSIV
jgi:hypothetical protein